MVSRYEKIIQILNQNPDEFNVRNNRVLNMFGNPIMKSNAIESLKHILNVSSEHTCSDAQRRDFFLRNQQDLQLQGFTEDGKLIKKEKEL